MELAIRTEHLTKIYSQRLIAVNDMNLEVPQGAVFGLLGPNGAGKMQDMQQFSEQMSNFLSRFSGAPTKPKTSKTDFFETKEFEDFSLFLVTLGYGLPTLAAVILATLCFYWRDL